jgi:hypothetical protein
VTPRFLKALLSASILISCPPQPEDHSVWSNEKLDWVEEVLVMKDLEFKLFN